VELGLRHGFKLFVTTTVTHQSLYSPGFTAIRELCERKGVVLWLLIGIPVGSWSGQLDVLIDEKDHAFMEQLNRRSRNLIRRDLSARFLNPRPDERELERIYPATYPCHATQQRALTVEIFRRLNLVRLKRRLGELHARRATDPLRILDVGCGDGFHLDLLRELFPRAELSGVEPAAEAARRARARGHTVHARRFEELEALPGSFDLIHAHHVLEHLARPDLFVERALALLGDDGLLLLETPSTDSLDFALLRGGRWGGYHAPRHWFLFSRRSATWMVERTGGQIRASGACTSSCFWTWSCHALTMDLLGRRVADALFPPLRIFEGGPQALLLLSSFAAFERALTAITGRGNGIWLLIGRRPGGSSFEARR
jgi:2-polyprenyl-3-methyl-5-hydroxy-6-metoxy-1,4-benzoquinol methylase